MPTARQTLLALILATPAAQADIYRCESDRGIVFSDRPCSEEATVVTIEDSSAGIAPGPPEEVREYLAQKREERAEERAARRQAAREAAARATPPVVTVERPVYPGWWGRPPYPPQRPRPPQNRPPSLLPLPEPLPPADGIDLPRR
jgi:hypothetical protein